MVQTQAVVSNGSCLVDTVDQDEELRVSQRVGQALSAVVVGVVVGVEGDLDAKRQRSYIVVSHDRDACYYYD